MQCAIKCPWSRLTGFGKKEELVELWRSILRAGSGCAICLDSLVQEGAHVLNFRDCLQAAALLWLFRLAGLPLHDYTSMSL